MTTMSLTPVVRNCTAAVNRYERLRRSVLSEARDADGTAGLAVLMRRGMRSYMESADASGSGAARACATKNDPDDGLRSEIARVMTAMALGAVEREARS